jgi:hypothetical protein
MQRNIPPSDRARFDAIFARLEAQSQARFGTAGVRLETVGYENRPYSWICRAALRDSPAVAGRHVFVKIFKPKEPAAGIDLAARVRQDFAITCEIHAFMTPWPELGAVKPIACYDDALAIVTEEASGTTLLDRLQQDASWFPNAGRVAPLVHALETVGRWLKCFQGFRPTNTTVPVESLRDYIDIRLKRMVDRQVMSARQREQILGHLEALGRLVGSADLREVAVHADLAPANILVSSGSVVVLDFAMTGRGTVMQDLARLYMQLELLRAKPQFRPRIITTLTTALLHGFDPALSPRHPLFRTSSMLHHVNHLGTLALRREPWPGRLLSTRVIGIHRRWIADELEAGAH